MKTEQDPPSAASSSLIVTGLLGNRRFVGSIAALLGIFLVFHCCRFMFPSDLYPVNVIVNGGHPRAGDYYDFYVAGQDPQISPYRDPRFNKPPLVASINRLFSLLPYKTAAMLWQVLIVQAVVLTIVGACRDSRQPRLVCGALIFVVFVAYPFEFLLDRGQLEGFSYGLAFAAFLCARRGRSAVGAALLALACHVKPQVLFLFPGLLLSLQQLQMAYTTSVFLATGVGIAALTPTWTAEFVGVALSRAGMELWMFENGSLARALFFLPGAEVVAFVAWLGLYVIFWWGLFGSRGRLGQATSAPTVFLLALPFCQAVPSLSFVYGLVYFPLMLLYYCAPEADARFRGSWRSVPIVACAGIWLTQFPCVQASTLLSHTDFWNWLPSVGVGVLMACSVLTVEGERRRSAAA